MTKCDRCSIEVTKLNSVIICNVQAVLCDKCFEKFNDKTKLKWRSE